MARKMGRNLKRAAAGLMACAAVALCAVSPAWGAERASDVVNVTVPTRIDCALGADGTVTSPGGLEVVNNGPQDLYVGASTVDDFGQKVEFAIDLGGSPLLSRAGGKDVEGEVEFAGSSRKGLGLAVSKLNRTSHAALMDAAAQGEATMFTVGFRFTFKALQGSMSISGEAELGKTLTAAVSGAQADAKLAYRWYRDGQLIAGAETASYTTNEADQGKKLKCEAYDAAGRYVGGVSAEVGPIKGPEAFAVFSADDGSLNFYKRIDVPKAGEQFEGRTVTEVYTGFENKEFAINNNPKPNWSDVTTNVPWFNRIQQILSARIIDKNIKPYQLSFWFTQCNNMTQVDLSNLDASRIKKAIGLFGRCHKLHTCILPSDMNNLTDLSDMFYECRTLNEVDLTCIGTSSVPRDLFSIFNGCLSLKTIQIPRQIVRNLGWGFAGCKSITDFSIVENWDVSHTAGTHDLFKVFAGCTSLTSLNLSKWKTSQSLNMEGMFGDCSNLKTLDISGFNTATVTNMAEMFSKCINLRQVTLGDNFAWKGIDGLLPTPNPNTIPGADGKWYAMSDKAGYAPADVPSNKADTYVASPDLLPKEAFAVFSADDGSLNFYKRNTVPAVGSQFEGKTVTSVYTGIEKDAYKTYSDVPWYSKRAAITNSRVVDVIKPVSTAFWFYKCSSLASIDVTNLDTSKVTSMCSMFEWCKSLASIDVTNLDTSNVTSMNSMFCVCSSLTTLDLSNFDTSSVTDMTYMFSGCHNLTSLDLSKFVTSSVTSMSFMVSSCYDLTFLDLSNFDTSSVTDMSDMFYCCSSLTTLDVSNFDTSRVTDMTGMFYECLPLTYLNLSNFDTSRVTDMSIMFYNCRNLTFLDVTSFDTSKVTNMSGMFERCSNLTALDLSSFDTSNVTTMRGMFPKWSKLQQVKLGNKFAWKGANGFLPVQSADSIPGADGKWYAMSDKAGYAPADVPSNKADTYVASPDLLSKEAFAVFSADDNSLSFYNRVGKPAEGSQFDGRTATKVYADIEKTDFISASNALWADKAPVIRTIRFRDVVKPNSTKNWFANMTSLERISFANLDMSACSDMSSMFYNCTSLSSVDTADVNTASVTSMQNLFENCSKLTALDLSKFRTTSVANMSRMFSGCSSLSDIKLTGLDVSHVEDMSYMFHNCSSLTMLDVSGFTTSAATNMHSMFYGCSNLRELDLSGFDTSKVTVMDFMFNGDVRLQTVRLGSKFAWKGSEQPYLPAPSATYIPGATGKWYSALTGAGHSPQSIPSNWADTYYASKSLAPSVTIPSSKGSVSGSDIVATINNAPGIDPTYEWHHKGNMSGSVTVAAGMSEIRESRFDVLGEVVGTVRILDSNMFRNGVFVEIENIDTNKIIWQEMFVTNSFTDVRIPRGRYIFRVRNTDPVAHEVYFAYSGSVDEVISTMPYVAVSAAEAYRPGDTIVCIVTDRQGRYPSMKSNAYTVGAGSNGDGKAMNAHVDVTESVLVGRAEVGQDMSDTSDGTAPAPDSESAPSPEPAPSLEPKPEAKPESGSEPESKPEPEPESEPRPEPGSVPEPEQVLETVSKPDDLESVSVDASA